MTEPPRGLHFALDDGRMAARRELRPHTEPPMPYQASPRHTLSAREVLDLHADMHRHLSRLSPQMRELYVDYARSDVEGHGTWAASHLHPSERIDNLEPWLRSLGADLFGATTYQVTAEMVELAEAMTVNNDDLADIREEDLPAPWGFMFFDRPVPRPSVEDGDEEPLKMHAVSWTFVPSMHVRFNRDKLGQLGETGEFRGVMPAVRVREWGWNDDPRVVPRPLHLMGQNCAVLTEHVRTPLPEMHFVHMVWILMGMEITASTVQRPDRHGARRAANLAQHEVHVVTLRRQAHDPDAIRHVDWTCTWLVRGHWRKAPHGGTFADGRTRTWIKPYIKGPEGLPLRAADILYKLRR